MSVIFSPVPFSQWRLDFIGQLPAGPGQFKYVIIIVDYNTKWTEVEPLATITTEKGTAIFYASPAHPQTNGQVEAINKLIKQNLNKLLEEAKGLWVAKLPKVLWTLGTTPTTATGESPYLLAYGTEAVILMEMEVPSERITTYDLETNVMGLRLNMDLLEEPRDKANLPTINNKQKIAKYYNKKVIPRPLKVGDWIMKVGDWTRGVIRRRFVVEVVLTVFLPATLALDPLQNDDESISLDF
ncbi:hypothetical protein ACLB2K_065945 [Fragaria x ananassa]